ncbi:MAG: type VI secretion system ATPase TssH, partial [Oscillospiraceae bacterium]|nr:type VI secretion system ATPase TssH [Oscillospiraceae bacterium]
MNAQKFTQKSLEAVQTAQSLTLNAGNQQMEQIHLFSALLRQEDGLTAQLLRKLELDLDALSGAVDAELAKLPAVTGSGREADRYYVSQAVDRALTEAERIAADMRDEYVSVEHLLLALIETADSVLSRLFKLYGITKERILQTLQSVRGSQRVTSDTPEETYDALKK